MVRSGNIGAISVEGRRLAAEVRIANADRRAAAVAPVIRELKATGLSVRGIARALTARGIRTPRGHAWSDVQVARVIARAAS